MLDDPTFDARYAVRRGNTVDIYSSERFVVYVKRIPDWYRAIVVEDPVIDCSRRDVNSL